MCSLQLVLHQCYNSVTNNIREPDHTSIITVQEAFTLKLFNIFYTGELVSIFNATCLSIVGSVTLYTRM